MAGLDQFDAWKKDAVGQPSFSVIYGHQFLAAFQLSLKSTSSADLKAAAESKFQQIEFRIITVPAKGPHDPLDVAQVYASHFSICFLVGPFLSHFSLSLSL